MIQSMTGFANKTIELFPSEEEKISLAISLKSLNSRFFEANCKLTYALSHLETKLIKTLKKKLRRGNVYLVVHVSGPRQLRGAVEPSLKIVESYINAINQIKEKFNIQGDASISDIVDLPNVFGTSDQQLDETSEQKILATINELIEQVIEARNQEGVELKKDIDQRVAHMEKEMDAVEITFKKAMEEQKQKVHETLKELEDDESKFADIQKNALYVLLDKMDINEEIVRFKSHLQNLKEHLASDQVEKGKRLDFTLQELGREINTIAAKSVSADMGSHAINIKVELEKVREQVQNIV